jgi:hypothetical protein
MSIPEELSYKHRTNAEHLQDCNLFFRNIQTLSLECLVELAPKFSQISGHEQIWMMTSYDKLCGVRCYPAFFSPYPFIADWWFGTFYVFRILGMSSSQLTFIFFRGVFYTTNQIGINHH